MKSKQGHHKEAEVIDEGVTRATQYDKKKQCEKTAHRFLVFRCSHNKDKKEFWCYLIARRKPHLNTTVICVAVRKE